MNNDQRPAAIKSDLQMNNSQAGPEENPIPRCCSNEAADFLSPIGCQCKTVKRTFSYAAVRAHAILAVLLSSIALYPAVLGILAAAVT